MLKKIVNGREVIMAPEEEAEIRAMWEASAAARDANSKTPQPTAADAILKDPNAIAALKAALAK